MSILSFVRKCANKFVNGLLIVADGIIKVSVLGFLFTIALTGASSFFSKQFSDKISEIMQGLKL